MEKKFEIGDRVELKSGSDLMTVQSIGDDSIECIWFDEDKKHIDTFKKEELKKASSGDNLDFEPEV